MKAALEQIERQALKVPTLPHIDHNLAEQAAEILGYHRMIDEKVEPLKPLAATLAALELDVLNPHQVKSYQLSYWKQKVQAVTEEWLTNATLESRLPDLPTWRERAIADYEEPIPAHILHKAIQIKQRMPEAVVMVEVLEDHADPFLKVATLRKGYYHVHDEEFYVDCWSEPTFESTQVAEHPGPLSLQKGTVQ
jgi:hypothetical protein